MAIGELSEEDIDALLGGAALESGETAELPELEPAVAEAAPRTLDLLMDVPLKIRIELGRAKLSVQEILSLGEGSVIELDTPVGEPVNIYVNDRIVARGEVLALNNFFCTRITEILLSEERT